MKYVTPRKASEYLGVSISTLRRWDEEGKIKSIRTPGGQRRFCIEEYEAANAKPTILYARVSTHSPKDDHALRAEVKRQKSPSAVASSSAPKATGINDPAEFSIRQGTRTEGNPNALPRKSQRESGICGATVDEETSSKESASRGNLGISSRKK